MSFHLYHCFGSATGHEVDTETAVAMLRASDCPYLTLNTHAPAADQDALKVGYSTATFGSVRRAWPGPPLEPVLNINLAKSADEAVERTRSAVALTGCTTIKLEVLDEAERLVDVAAVVEAAGRLSTPDPALEVWPLIMPDVAAFAELQASGCPMIRVMGSEIGSRKGILPEWEEPIERILAIAEVPVMLDGGIGTVEHAVEALRRGFDSVLVNSCLFDGSSDPAERLSEFRAAIDRLFLDAAQANAG